MLKRVVLLIACLIWMMPGILPVVAEEDPLWTAWLYNAADGRMTLVSDAGETLSSFRLPLPTGYDYHPFQVAVSHSGSRIAYIPANANNARRVLVYDVPSRKLLVDYALLPPGDEAADILADDAQGFNETDSALAFGYGLEDGGWQVAVLDLESGLVTLVLSSSSPAVTIASMPQDSGLVPVVQHFAGLRVTFTLVDTQADNGQPERGSYTWNLSRSTISVDSTYPALDNDYLMATGEVIVAVADSDLSNDAESFAYGQSNALYVYDPANEALFPFFNTPDLSLFFPHFIQGGARILVGGIDADGQSGWLVIERDGAGVGAWSPPAGTIVSSAEGTADGFIYTADTVTTNRDGGHTTLFSVSTGDTLLVGSPVWSSTAGDYPRLVWINDRRPVSRNDFRSWTHLDE